MSDRSTHGGKVIGFWYVSNPVHPYVNVGSLVFEESWERRPMRKVVVFFWGRDEEVEACSISGVTVKEGGDSWTGG